VTAADEHRYDAAILDTRARREVVDDGAMRTQLQAADLTLDDFHHRRRCGQDEIRSAANWLTLVSTSPLVFANCRSRR
jgi:methionine synthase I (cobalamin-dependent)